MHTADIKVNVETEVLIGGQNADDVIATIVDNAHDIFYFLSHFTDEHEEFKENHDIESIEGRLCEILTILGD